MSSKFKRQIAVAACSIELRADGNVLQILPAAERFKAIDGRPAECAEWVCTAATGARLVADKASRINDLVIDYDHQTLRAKENGQPAPAAGWFNGKDLHYTPGQGLTANNVRWTERAKQMIAADEIRYFSPVFSYDPKTGEVLSILMGAITNNPGLDGMAEIAALAATIPTNEGDYNMDELLERLRWFFNLPITATAEEITAQINKLHEILRAGQAAQGTAAASFNLIEFVTGSMSRIAALQAQTPDPAKFVSVETMRDLQLRVATLTAQIAGREVDEVVTAALTAGKLLPAQEKWARDLGKTDLAALKSYIDTAQPIAALAGTQTGGKGPAGNEGGLSDSELAVCTSMGLSAEDYKKTRDAT